MAGFFYEKRVNERIEQCVKLGLQYIPKEDAYIKGNVYIPVMDIKTLGDTNWAYLMKGAKAQLKDKNKGMINLMKQHPYRTIAIALIVVGLAVTALIRADVAKGALFFSAQPLFGDAPAPIVATSTGVILDGTSTQDFTDATPIQIEKATVKTPIIMSAKAQRIIELKEQIVSLQNELSLLEAN